MFRVADLRGDTLFKVDRDSVEIAAKSLDVQGEGGVTFENSILTSKLEAEPGKHLKWALIHHKLDSEMEMIFHFSCQTRIAHEIAKAGRIAGHWHHIECWKHWSNEFQRYRTVGKEECELSVNFDRERFKLEICLYTF